MSRARWYRGTPPASVEVDCQGEKHRVRWKRGRLILEAHDAAGEAALAALGGAPCPCLDVLTAWREGYAKVRAEGFSLQLVPPRRVAISPDPGLSAPLTERFALGCVVRCQRAWASPDGAKPPDRQLVSVAHVLSRRFKEAVGDSLAPSKGARPGLDVTVSVRLNPAGEPVTAELEGSRRRLTIRAGLPLGWMVSVWGRQAAAVDGRLVLEVLAQPSIDRLAVLAITWGAGRGGTLAPQVAPVWLVRDGGADADGRWRVDEDAAPPPLRTQAWWSIRMGR
ncbi:MAG: hypothetical protein ACKVWR_17065 [Acidimicrobiales bacterium]